MATHDRIVIGGILVPVLWGGGMAWTLSDAKLLRATLLLLAHLRRVLRHRLPAQGIFLMEARVETRPRKRQFLPPDFVRAMLAGHSALGLAFAG